MAAKSQKLRNTSLTGITAEMYQLFMKPLQLGQLRFRLGWLIQTQFTAVNLVQ